MTAMTKIPRLLRRLLVVLAVGTAARAAAHEFTCENTVGILEVDAAGNPVVLHGGFAAFSTPPVPVLVLDAYPVVLGFQIELVNVASATSVVTAVSNGLSGATIVRTFGFDLAPGFDLPPGGSAIEVLAVPVASQAQCLQIFGGLASEGPVCSDLTEDRFVVFHDAGSTECRSRIVCGSPVAPQPSGSGP